MLKVGTFMNRHRANYGLLIAALMLAPACAVDQDTTSTNAPIAQVALDSGLTVSFYEPLPGLIAISQDAPASVPLLDNDDRTATEMYASLAPGRPVPEALVAAQQRADAALAGRPRPTVPAVTSNAGATTTQSFIDNKTIDDKWFVDNRCDGAYDVIRCRINLTAPTSSDQPAVTRATYSACTDVGKITMHVYVLGVLQGSWDILEDHCHSYSWNLPPLVVSAFGEVFNVNPDGNDRFHFSARYNF